MVKREKTLWFRLYLRSYCWLRHQCDRLTIHQRKGIIYGLSFIYLVCALVLLVQSLHPKKKVPERQLIEQFVDSPIQEKSTSINNYYQRYYT